MAAVEIERFRAKDETSEGQDSEGEYLDLPKAPPPIINYQWLKNGRLAMGSFPHVHETAQE